MCARVHHACMATLDSSSTLQNALDQHADNLSYRSQGSVSMAHLFVEACEWLIARLPEEHSKSGVSTRMSIKALEEQRKAALDWISRNQTSTPRVKFMSVEGFR